MKINSTGENPECSEINSTGETPNAVSGRSSGTFQCGFTDAGIEQEGRED